MLFAADDQNDASGAVRLDETSKVSLVETSLTGAAAECEIRMVMVHSVMVSADTVAAVHHNTLAVAVNDVLTARIRRDHVDHVRRVMRSR